MQHTHRHIPVLSELQKGLTISKWVIRSLKSKKDRKSNDQKKNDKKTSTNKTQNPHQNTKPPPKHKTPTKTEDDLSCSVRVYSCCFTS